MVWKDAGAHRLHFAADLFRGAGDDLQAIRRREAKIEMARIGTERGEDRLGQRGVFALHAQRDALQHVVEDPTGRCPGGPFVDLQHCSHAASGG